MLGRNRFVAAADRDQAGSFVDAFSRHSIAKRVSFQPGELLRQKGVHYRDMFLTIDGDFEVDFETESNSSKLRISEPDTPIGEIGFLRGTAASATVKAASNCSAVLIDDDVLETVERDQPAIAAGFLHRLAQVAEERTSFNFLTSGKRPAYSKGAGIEILVCRTDEMLKRAQTLRYEVYCGELGANLPMPIMPKEQSATISTASAIPLLRLRTARSWERCGAMSPLSARSESLRLVWHEHLRASPARHGCLYQVCRRNSRRGGPTAFKLIAAVVRYGLQRQLRECYIDCIPSLLPYYKAMGFVACGQRFLHRENGPSDPLMLDIDKYGKRLTVEMGPLSFMAFLIRSQSHKLRDRFAGTSSVSES